MYGGHGGPGLKTYLRDVGDQVSYNSQRLTVSRDLAIIGALSPHHTVGVPPMIEATSEGTGASLLAPS